MPLTPVLTKRFGTDQPWKIDNYERSTATPALRKALAMAPDELIAMVKDSNLRGRGGAGFPTGMKWQFIPQAKPGERQAALRRGQRRRGRAGHLPRPAADDERPALDDRGHHHRLLRGARRARVHLHPRRGGARDPPGHRARCARRTPRATSAPTSSAPASTVDITVHGGAGAYICGEETALLDSLEGKRGQPRLKPPFPATNGLYDAPTVVNNVGTLASVPYIVLGGADWFKAHGPGRARPARRSTRCPDGSRTRASTRRRWAPRCAS